MGISGIGGVGAPSPFPSNNEKNQLAQDIEAYLQDPSAANLKKVGEDLQKLEKSGSISFEDSVVFLYSLEETSNLRQSIDKIEQELSHLSPQSPEYKALLNTLNAQEQKLQQMQHAWSSLFSQIPSH